MRSIEAIHTALAMLSRPQLCRLVREASLPSGVTFLLKIASGDRDAICQAQTLTGTSEALLREAAGFFIEQILLYSKGDCYRVLGSSHAARGDELRLHMVLMLKWLHPDLRPQSGTSTALDRSAYAILVTDAWEQLKTKDRRSRYDAEINRQLAARTGMGRASLLLGRSHDPNQENRRRLVLYKYKRNSF